MPEPERTITAKDFQVVLGLHGSNREYFLRRGIGRYSCGYTTALCGLAAEHVAQIEMFPDLQGAPLLDPAGIPVVAAHEWAQRPLTHSRLVHHILSPFEPRPLANLWPRWARAADVASVVTLYDVIPLLMPERYLHGTGYTMQYMSRIELLRNADAVVAISEAAAEDAVRLAGLRQERIHVVGIASPLPEPSAADVERGIRASHSELPLGGRAPVVSVSGNDDRKNADRLIEAYASMPPALRRRHPLVLVGRLGRSRRARLQLVARMAGAHHDVHFAGSVSDDALIGLHAECAVAVFPSLAEGFGLPALEALKAGAPTIASDIPSLREVIKDPLARFDPRSVEHMASVLERVLSEPLMRGHLRRQAPLWARPFTWERVVDRHRAAYEIAVRRRASRGRASRAAPAPLDVVCVPGLGPLASDYIATLAAVMSDQHEVALYGGAVGSPPHVGGFASHPIRQLRWRSSLAGSSSPPLVCLAAVNALQALPILAHQRCDVLLLDSPGPTTSTLAGQVLDTARRLFVFGADTAQAVRSARPDRAGDVHAVDSGFPAVAVDLPASSHGVVLLGSREPDADVLREIASVVDIRPQIELRIVVPESSAALSVAVQGSMVAIVDARCPSAEIAPALSACLGTATPTIFLTEAHNGSMALASAAAQRNLDALAPALAELLDVPARRETLGRDGKEYARAHPMSGTADSVIDLMTSR